MAQFGAGKNPPWVRDPSGLPQPGVAVVGGMGQPVPGAGTLLNQPGVATPTVYSLATTQIASGAPQYSTQQIGVANLAAVAPLPQPGIAIPTTLATSQVQTVSYPAPRAAVQGPPGPQPKQRVFTGTVTKLHDSFGFVDEDVFFQTNCVKGAIPKVGDRVLVEASYNANMPFKWNATRIQVLPQQQKTAAPPPSSNIAAAFNAAAKPVTVANSQFSQPPPPLMSQNPQPPPSLRNQPAPPPGSRRIDPPSYDRSGRDRGSDRDRRSPPRSRRSPARKRSRSPRRRSRSPARRSSPPRSSRRAARASPRYMVQVPKISLDTREANVITLKSRYSNMYVPSDFFNCAFSWVEAFPMHRPFELGKQCTYHVMHKEVEPINKNETVLEPPDADHLYSAKVMLSACPTMDELYKKSCHFIEDPSDNRENLQHPTRLMNFLVGMKGKEPMAIGGPWSPSLDGSQPGEDPRVLINTAIRTTRALTGIDLAGVTQWYRFAEIRYHRPEEVHKGRVVPARVETVVLFLPDVWSCNPSRIEWDALAVAYKRQLADRYKEDTVEETQEEEDEEGEGNIEVKDPTHHSELDPKNMKVTDLRRELEARALSSKGLKSQLIARLTKAIKSEVEKEEKEAENKEEEVEEPVKEPEPSVEPDDKDEEKKKKEDEEKKRRDERERAVRERRYTLPDTPAIIVHPSTTAKSGKFDCTMMSLSVLLDYRPDDNKEHTFEVSLFAELFNEMLMRDFGFNIYKALNAAPEKPKEEKDKKHDKKDSKQKDEPHKNDDKHKDEKDKKEKKESDKKESEETSEEPPAKKRKEEEKRKESTEKKDDKKKEDDKEKSEDKDVKEDDDDDKKSTKSEREEKKEKERERDRKHKVKMVTADPGMLLSFSYFDLSHAGYLLDKDTEDILHTIGLHLSRSQVKKLVSRIMSKDQVQYRKLTDKPAEKDKKEEDSKESKEQQPVAVKEEDESVKPAVGAAADEGEQAAASTEEDMEQEETVDDETLAKGNKPLLPQHGAPKDSPEKKTRGGKRDSDTVNMISFKGSMLDIPSMVQRLEKSEKLKRETDSKLKDLQEEMDMIKDSCKSSEQNSQKVALELQELKKRLRDQRKATDRSENDAKKYHEALSTTKSHLNIVMSCIQDATGDRGHPEVKREVNGE